MYLLCVCGFTLLLDIKSGKPIGTGTFYLVLPENSLQVYLYTSLFVIGLAAITWRNKDALNISIKIITTMIFLSILAVILTT